MRTLGDVLGGLFPHGTGFPEVTGLVRDDGSSAPSYGPPQWPPDLFAFCARVLDLSGAYHHVAPPSPAIAPSAVRRLQLPDAERDAAVKAGREWHAGWHAAGAGFPPPPSLLSDLWADLAAHFQSSVYVARGPLTPAPTWWSAALRLAIIADEASRDMGFELAQPGTGVSDPLVHVLGLIRYVEGEGDGLYDDNFFSMSFANRDMVCVLPKSRTPRVGCTLRSLSHNLALLPPRGEVRARWFNPFGRDPGPGLDEALKVLIVPFPYRIGDDCFEPVSGSASAGDEWGWFRVNQRWLGDPADAGTRSAEFAEFVLELVAQAGSSGSPVGAVVLPEASLDEAHYRALADALMTRTDVEILVNGTGQGPASRDDVDEDVDRMRAVPRELLDGNFVSQTLFFRVGEVRQAMRSVREKHHRWRVERHQIAQYGLERRLDPALLWWERIDITSRSLDLMTFRSGATMTSLICEDLARVDPCQLAVRAIGPTLLVSLLMDGSQIAGRWPGRYATILSEDPGCSVLTVTSLGLIERTDPTTIGGASAIWSVGLWSDPVSGPVALVLDPSAHAVCLTLRAASESEGTLEGRIDRGDAVVWLLDDDEAPRSVTATRAVPGWLLSGR